MTRQENLIYRKQCPYDAMGDLSLIHISEPTRQAEISYAVFCLKKKKKKNKKRYSQRLNNWQIMQKVINQAN